jgi:peptidoglycan/LPS O-acetylase OafA/YrhL
MNDGQMREFSAMSKSNRIPSLDGIRGLAIGLVLFWHGFYAPLNSLRHHPFASRLISLARLSWSGVDLFFVLSGFLIGGILLDTAYSKRYFAPFYVRRAHRILPLYALVMAFVFLVPLVLRNSPYSRLANSIPLPYYLGFLQNFWMAKNASFGSNLLGVTWSLAVEEQFYLTLPLTIRYISRSRLGWVVGGMIAGAPVLRLLVRPFSGYVLMPCRMDALGWGLAAALITRDLKLWEVVCRRRKWVYLALGGTLLGVIGLLLSGFRPFTKSLFGLEYSLLSLLYFLLLLSTLLNGRLEAVFSMRPLRHLGIIAYGLYLLHRPCLFAVQALAIHFYPGPSGWAKLGISFSGLVLTTLLATMSWEYMEKPLIKRAHGYRYSDEPWALRRDPTPASSRASLP